MERVVETCDGANLLLAVKVLHLHPALQFLALRRIGTEEGVDEHVGFLVGGDVAADGLAKHLLVAIDVEIVVLQLEGQSYLFAKAIEIVGVLLRGPCEDGTNLQRTSQQHAGLQTDHLDILVLGHVRALLKLHVQLLTVAYLQRRLREEVEHGFQPFCRTLRHHLIGQYQHRVAREDGLVVVPLHVHRRFAATLVSIVHQVVVEQGVVVIGLQCAGRSQYALRILAEEVVGQQHQRRADALAT